MNIVQQTIRIPEERNNYIKEKAEKIGCTYNSFVNILIDKGLQLYEATPVLHLGENQYYHSPLRND
jgi:hypothetical protein